KRFLDVLFACLLFLVSLPLFLIISLIVKFKLGSPVLFKQERPGKNEAIFNLYKFRSMKLIDPEKGLITDSQRLTSFGKFLRSTSLDELPSLVNVIRGDMSFVGPRPLLVKYLELYSDEQRLRHRVRPGITGLAQTR